MESPLPGAAADEERPESSMSSREEMLEKQRQLLRDRQKRNNPGLIQSTSADSSRAPARRTPSLGPRRVSETQILSPAAAEKSPVLPATSDSTDLTKKIAQFGFTVEHNPDEVRFDESVTTRSPSLPPPSAGAVGGAAAAATPSFPPPSPLKRKQSMGKVVLGSSSIDIEDFVTRPAPQGEEVQCTITRDKTGMDKMHPTYFLKLEKKEGAEVRSIFLLAGRKRRRSKTSNYLISLDATDLTRDGESFLAKLRANFVGTHFTIYDGGRNPAKSDQPELPVRRELGTVQFEANVLGLKGPRKMTVVLPAIGENGLPIDLQPTKVEDTLEERLKQTQLDGLLVLRNKQPTWNADSQSWVLNFRGRVTQASVKNFQIVHESDENYIVMQFGRVSDNEFTMDYRYPMSAVQAFAIALSSFDGKLAVE